jgi:(p)ppGpp synthase/HD superfamily hydrolase
MRKYEGIPYVTHPMAVAMDVADKYKDKELVLAALLHDIVEDCNVRFQDVYKEY